MLQLHATLLDPNGLLDTLQRSAEQARNYKIGRFVTVEAEAGIGKSRRMRELAARLRPTMRVFQIALPVDTSSASYGLFIALLHAIFELDARQEQEEQREQVRAVVEGLLGAQTTDKLVPIFWLLGVASAEERQGIEGLEPKQQRQQLRRAVHALLLQAASAEPFALLVDDAQRMDSESAHLLMAILAKRAALPAIVVLFLRPIADQEVHPLQQLFDLPPDARHHLEPFTEQQARDFLAALLQWPDAPTLLEELVLARGQGIPFLIEELVRNMIESGLLARQEGQWQLDEARASDESLLPLTVQMSVLDRVERLPQPARILLEVAAVLGVRMMQAELLEAAGQVHPVWRRQVWLGALTPLYARGFLLRGANAEEVGFRHNLVQEAILYNLTPAILQRYHSGVAAALEQLYPDPSVEIINRLARHYSEAGAAVQALRYLRQAAAKAREFLSWEQAEHFYKRAFEHFPVEVRQQPELFLEYGDLLLNNARYKDAFEIYQAGLTVADQETGARFYRQLGIVHMRQSNYEAADKSLRKALETVNPRNTQGWGIILSELGWVRFQQGQLEEAEKLLDQALTMLRYGGDVHAERAQVYNRLAGVAFRRGDLRRAQELIERSMDSLATVGDLLGMAKAHTNLGSIATQHGDYKNGIEQREQALMLFQRLGNVEGQTIVLLNLGSLYEANALFPRARELADEGLALAREIGQPSLENHALNLIAWAMAYLENPATAIPLLRQSLQFSQEVGSTMRAYEVSLRLGETLLLTGEEAHLEEVEKIVHDLLQAKLPVDMMGELWRVRAHLSLQQGKLDEALRSIQTSLEVQIGEALPPFNLLASQAVRVAILRAQGKTEEAAAQREETLRMWQARALPKAPIPDLIQAMLAVEE